MDIVTEKTSVTVNPLSPSPLLVVRCNRRKRLPVEHGLRAKLAEDKEVEVK